MNFTFLLNQNIILGSFKELIGNKYLRISFDKSFKYFSSLTK